MSRGLFVAFEGGDGSGKSTQARLLADSIGAVLTREPGGTGIGEKLRAILLDPAAAEMSDRTEALLMAADRAQHVAELIEPALAAGRHVVSDRFLASSVAYQGYGRGLGPDFVRDLSLWATAGLQPDLVVLIDVPDRVAEGRRGTDPDRMEASGAEFHRSVAEGYRAQAAGDPGRWLVVDGQAEVAEVAAAVLSGVTERLGHLRDASFRYGPD